MHHMVGTVLGSLVHLVLLVLDAGTISVVRGQSIVNVVLAVGKVRCLKQVGVLDCGCWELLQHRLLVLLRDLLWL